MPQEREIKMYKKRKNYWVLASSVFLFILGGFLIADSLIFHSLVMDYSIFGITALDEFIDHWMWGVLSVCLGVGALWQGYN